MLQAITACKLYRASSRKEKINAAFNNPINKELIGQLAKALNEEYMRPELLVKNYGEKKPYNEPEPEEHVVEPEGDHGAGGAPSSPSHGAPPSSNHDSAEPELDSNPESSESTSSDTSGSDLGQSSPAPVEETTKIQGQPIKASLAREKFKDMKQVSDEIKGLLNFKDSTTGVNRILVKEDEMWIYYNDDVNLNNVMGEVIEVLNASLYTYLEFNRLARSDNAIVFQVMFKDTNAVMQSIQENKDE